MRDGAHIDVDRVILATGFMGHDHLVGQLFGRAVADTVGPIWGIDPDTSELRNMWMRTRQPGLWFTGGSFSQCRIYSKYLAMQIAAIEAGLLSKELPEPQERAAPREAALA
jgi:putative flavoprotein involved in K+ transport